jgi:ElaB/YqjD/DUF883 family membrane-anchored ribosome-binding protein
MELNKVNNDEVNNKVLKDAEKVKKDFNAVVGDGAEQLGKFGENVSHAAVKATDDINTWVESNASQLRSEYDALSNSAKEAVADAANKAKKNVGHQFNQYNAKAQKFADKVPGGLSENVNKYPWVALSVAVTIGFLIGALLKSNHRTSLR